LINDRQFCANCFNEFMIAEYTRKPMLLVFGNNILNTANAHHSGHGIFFDIILNGMRSERTVL
jgi:hypothetical protein